MVKGLRYHGYKEATVQTRAMTLGELKLYILRAYAKKGFREVQMIDLTSGESATFNSDVDVLKNEWIDSCMIEVINLPHSYGFEGEDGKTIVIFQEAEENEHKVIGRAVSDVEGGEQDEEGRNKGL